MNADLMSTESGIAVQPLFNPTQPGTSRNLLLQENQPLNPGEKKRLLLNTNSELLSNKDINQGKSESGMSSTESLKESLPKLSQLSTKHP